jgi:hypothetical protein
MFISRDVSVLAKDEANQAEHHGVIENDGDHAVR